MPTLDPEIKATLEKYGLGQDAVWAHKQSGKYIMYHWACEHIAIKAGIEWDRPAIISAEPEKKIAVVCVFGKLGDRNEWSFGEAAPYNTSQTYPFSMSEKRGKDRVVLKLIGLHGKVYSEDESDDFRQTNTPTNGAVKVPTSKPDKWTGPLKATELSTRLRDLATALRKKYDAGDIDGFMALRAHEKAVAVEDQAELDMPLEYLGEFKGVKLQDGTPYKELFDTMEKELMQAHPLSAG